MSVSNTAARLRRILTVFRFLFVPEYLTIRPKEPESDIVLYVKSTVTIQLTFILVLK